MAYPNEKVDPEHRKPLAPQWLKSKGMAATVSSRRVLLRKDVGDDKGHEVMGYCR
jgi:hypothetical protein